MILEWTNNGCPFVQKHYNSQNMQKTRGRSDRGGRRLAVSDFLKAWRARRITASRGRQAHPRSRRQADLYVLLDPDGSMGRAYGAKTTPHMFIITPDGKIAYNGAIDSIKSNKVEDVATAVNYVTTGLAALKAGKAPDPALTVPYGCDVKY